jgi:hypothetical protein
MPFREGTCAPLGGQVRFLNDADISLSKRPALKLDQTSN